MTEQQTPPQASDPNEALRLRISSLLDESAGLIAGEFPQAQAQLIADAARSDRVKQRVWDAIAADPAILAEVQKELSGLGLLQAVAPIALSVIQAIIGGVSGKVL
jgi:hypothetical protein